MGLDLQFLWAQEFNKGSPEAVVTEWIKDRVDGRIDPQEPERCFVPIHRDTVTMASSADDHKKGVRCPTKAKNAHNDR